MNDDMPRIGRPTRKKQPKLSADDQKAHDQLAYTHKDRSGMAWRFSGGRPVSALADEVMRKCGYGPV